MASNVDILTKSHTVLKAKARAKKGQIESVVFDDDARRFVILAVLSSYASKFINKGVPHWFSEAETSEEGGC